MKGRAGLSKAVPNRCSAATFAAGIAAAISLASPASAAPDRLTFPVIISAPDHTVAPAVRKGVLFSQSLQGRAFVLQADENDPAAPRYFEGAVGRSKVYCAALPFRIGILLRNQKPSARCYRDDNQDSVFDAEAEIFTASPRATPFELRVEELTLAKWREVRLPYVRASTSPAGRVEIRFQPSVGGPFPAVLETRLCWEKLFGEGPICRFVILPGQRFLNHDDAVRRTKPREGLREVEWGELAVAVKLTGPDPIAEFRKPLPAGYAQLTLGGVLFDRASGADAGVLQVQVNER